MQPFTRLTSRVAVLPVDDVDTDQVIPARFLKITDKVGLGDKLFADWRRAPSGDDPGFVLDRPETRGARVLFVGRNFGCGSSREHAPWALCGWGFAAVVATSFADIFRTNALKNGLLPVALDEVAHAHLRALLDADPRAEVTVDLDACVLRMPDGREASFPIDGFARRCLLAGIDELGYLSSLDKDISRWEAEHG